ncbi:MAG: pirin family protein [Steroidobacteraceae bacterium]|jgi:redox-sensitive bicupin YhaK (pirin superfamily)
MTLGLHFAGRSRDLGGGFGVHRYLPDPKQQSVGPFVFFDHFGPVVRRPEDNFDVRPHPHVGLATVTYLFEGSIEHRDSLGSVQRIEPGAINWMNAGSGIVHSERAPADLRSQAHALHGLQLWVALPLAHEDSAPTFVHTAARDLPTLVVGGTQVRVLVGEAFGAQSPVQSFSETLYLDVQAGVQSQLTLPASTLERAIFALDKAVVVDGAPLAAGELGITARGGAIKISAPAGAHYLIIGGEPLDGPRTIWWNFVASSHERIEAAKARWREQRFGKVPGDEEFIPLPP